MKFERPLNSLDPLPFPSKQNLGSGGFGGRQPPPKGVLATLSKQYLLPPLALNRMGSRPCRQPLGAPGWEREGESCAHTHTHTHTHTDGVFAFCPFCLCRTVYPFWLCWPINPKPKPAPPPPGGADCGSASSKRSVLDSKLTVSEWSEAA